MNDDGRHYETIWLQPWCEGCETHCRGGDDGRQWCRDDVWEKCDECGNKSVRYVLAPEAPCGPSTKSRSIIPAASSPAGSKAAMASTGPAMDTVTGGLEEIRAIFRAAGLIKLDRDVEDEPQIVETWV